MPFLLNCSPFLHVCDVHIRGKALLMGPGSWLATGRLTVKTASLLEQAPSQGLEIVRGQHLQRTDDVNSMAGRRSELAHQIQLEILAPLLGQ